MPPSGCSAAGPVAGLAVPAYLPNVFTPSIIAGPINAANKDKAGGGIACDGTALIGISNADEDCSAGAIPVPAAISATLGNCPAGQWPRGTDASGGLICAVP